MPYIVVLSWHADVMYSVCVAADPAKTCGKLRYYTATTDINSTKAGGSSETTDKQRSNDDLVLTANKL